MNLTAANFITLFVQMNNTKCTFIIDSGADISVFKWSGISPTQHINQTKRHTITGVTDGILETLGETATLLKTSNGLTFQHSFQLVHENFPIPTNGLLGRDFLIKYKCTIDYEYWLLNFNYENLSISIPIEDNLNRTIVIPQRCEVIRNIQTMHIQEDMVLFSQEIKPGVFCGNSIISPNSKYIKIMNTTNFPVNINITDFKPFLEPLNNYAMMNFKTKSNNQKRTTQILDELDMTNVPEYAKNDLISLIKQYADIFSLQDEPITTNNFYEQNINLTDKIPIYIPNYKTIHSQGEEIENQIGKMLKDNVIEPSISPYNNPILLVPKKSEDNTKKWRLVVDFRQLNKKILADKFPLPRIDSILDQLGRAKFFTALDLMSGFHQIPLEKCSRKFTSFSTQSGHYQFTRLPFGLNISPNSFQRMMTIAMAGLTPECAFVYIDDIIVIGCSMQHHLQNLSRVFERLRKYNLKLNLRKCKFFNREVTYLGHRITDKGILPDSTKFETIKNYPVPKNSDEVRRFVAFCNYYRKFVPNFATIAYPLNQLLKKNKLFEWTAQCNDSFNTLKSFLISPMLLQYPDFKREFILTTDASDVGCGAVLSQIVEGNDLPIAFASKSFTPGEKNKSVILKELTAIHWGMNYFKAYLYGQKFVVRTDHRPLVFLFNMKNPTSKLTRMRLDLEDFDFNIEYIKGKANVGADALSRIVKTSEELKTMNVLVVNTRSMTRKQKGSNTFKKNDDLKDNSEIDHLAIYTTENPTETRKLPKFQVTTTNNMIIFTIYRGTRRKAVLHQFTIKMKSQTLAFALSMLENEMKQKNISKIAISSQDKLFEMIPIQMFKELSLKTLNQLQIIIYNPPKFISEPGVIQQILRNYHAIPTGGHIGQHRLYLKLREVYTWTNMKSSISQFIKACELCKKNKIIKHTKEKFTITSTPSKPFEVVQIDTIGPLPRSNNMNRYAVTIQCELTKYIVLIPIPTKEANIIAKALVEKFILIYGKFIELKSDQGTEYKNEILTQICKLLQIKQTFSTAYHPQTIGSLERNHRCLNEYLRSFVNEHQTDWDDWLQYYAFVYNTTPHSDHGFTPYELVFGLKAKLPHETLTDKIDPVYNIDLYSQELRYKLQKSHQIANQKLVQQKNIRKESNDSSANPLLIQTGDIVFLKNENRRKLDSFYTGPYKVKSINNPNCEIIDMQSNQSNLVHKNRLSKF